MSASWDLECHLLSYTQAVVLQAVQDNAAGQPQFEIALYVTALQDGNITGNRQLLHVVDQRMLPGENISFPLVKSLLSLCWCPAVQHLDGIVPVYALYSDMARLGSLKLENLTVDLPSPCNCLSLYSRHSYALILSTDLRVGIARVRQGSHRRPQSRLKEEAGVLMSSCGTQLIQSVPYMGTGTTVGYTSNMSPSACSSTVGSAAVSYLSLLHAALCCTQLRQRKLLQGVLQLWSCPSTQL